MVCEGNVGLGKQTILQLSKHNPKCIYLAARSKEKGLAAIQEIKATNPSAHIKFIQCDLADLSSVQAAAQEFTSKEQRLDILILNAGVMAVPAATTVNGYEIQFGINHIGHALLTKLLLSILLKTAAEPGADVRVVCLSSIGHISTPWNGIQFGELKGTMKWYPSLVRYAQSKLANILFAKELARRYPTITSVAVHPGVVDTELYRTMFSGWMGLGKVMIAAQKVLYTSVEEGAKNQLWGATAKKGEGKGELKSGEYYTPVGLAGNGSWKSEDKDLAGKLWEWTENELEGYNL
jgi:NAD(P)-dependent dehydrogenase (short-subunit alcohol dehydrogenase family)